MEKIYVVSDYARRYYQGYSNEQLKELRRHLEHQIRLIDSGGAAQLLNKRTGKPQKEKPMPWMREHLSQALKIIIEEQQSRGVTKS